MKIKIIETFDRCDMIISSTVSENRMMRLAKIDLQSLFHKISWCHYNPKDFLNSYIPCEFLTLNELILHMENERDAKAMYWKGDFYIRINDAIAELKRINKILKKAEDDNRVIEYPIRFLGYFPIWRIHRNYRYAAI